MPKLLTLDADYALSTIHKRQLEHELLCTDLDGFFEHVWTVHPLVGADPHEQPDAAVGPPATMRVSDRHTIIEATVSYSARLTGVPRINCLIGQAVLLAHLVRLVRKESISVVRAGDPYYLALLGLIVARVHRLPLVVRVNGNYDAVYKARGRLAYPRIFRWRSVEKRVERFILPRADLVACGNQNNLEYAVKNGARTERTTLFRIGNIISPVHFVEPARRPSVRGELGLEGRPLLVFVGRLERVKFPEDVLHVVAEAKAHVPRLAAVLVGDGSMRADLADLARELRIESDVTFAGPRDQGWVARLMSSADVIVSPVTGRALVEAALSGTAIVAYDYEWQGELLESGKSAVLVPYRDVEEMAKAVIHLLQHQQIAVEVGAQARADALEMMDPVQLVRHERTQYELLLAPTGRPE